MQTFAEVQAASSAAYRTLGDLEWEVVHIPVRTGGIFYFPWHIHQIEGTNGF